MLLLLLCLQTTPSRASRNGCTLELFCIDARMRGEKSKPKVQPRSPCPVSGCAVGQWPRVRTNLCRAANGIEFPQPSLSRGTEMNTMANRRNRLSTCGKKSIKRGTNRGTQQTGCEIVPLVCVYGDLFLPILHHPKTPGFVVVPLHHGSIVVKLCDRKI